MEALHIASILGDSGSVFAFGVERRLQAFLNDKITALGLNSILTFMNVLSIYLLYSV